MNATPDLFSQDLPQPDLRSRVAWQVIQAQTGERLENVIISFCGRFTVVRYEARGEHPEYFLAFRRFGPPERARWDPPALLGKYRTADDARDRCARFVEEGGA
jgi:hypothetical protein